MKILIATKNPAKVRELTRYLQHETLELLSLADFPRAPNVEETGETFEENALLKAKTYFEWSKIPTLADDGGLEIDVLNGDPGVMSRRWSGREMSDQEMTDMVLDKLKGVPWEKRTTRFRIVLAFYDGAHTETATASTEGYITEEQRGPYEPGFPFRAIFRVSKLNKMFNELTPEEHEQVNHRRFACAKIREKILAWQNGSQS